MIALVRLILASESPRRAELLSAAGFAFDIVQPRIEEAPRPGESPEMFVERAAREKLAQVECRESGTVVIAADTVVVIDGTILGKPRDAEHAMSMLKRLSGRHHEVLTGVAVRAGEQVVTAVERTAVHFLPLSDEEIAWYVASGEPRDKAGAYAVQGLGSRFVHRIEGSYSNVVGLPVATVYRLLRQLG